jgi:hypothetical protein
LIEVLQWIVDYPEASCGGCEEQFDAGDRNEWPCADCPQRALPDAARRVLADYRVLASGLCRDVPALGLVALEVLAPRMTRPEALAWLENLGLVHSYLMRAAAKRAQRASE